ncbi:predicted protein [Phaeodactylum tricornutum CCAP 1055/1]|uniref:Uncharacterized protein n=2 Tax=Phaeodactylum tricornutum TaxID=2850 RepID=B7FVS3_PHATC|nr:predicted protein [Phaeodactylum tricornutum CCAP 1055/1]EEC49453.1 predicted protein [Phaeodactylum tricornutum CCAP 1055/1]|eukprot:XP_002178755.1 predicted protein [Phaeodactylum tricornutum CCAP 1055/1]
MMDGAYFVGRKELLDFFNDLLDLNLSKIEQTASGAIACQIADLIFPKTIPMSKVNWEARSDYEFVQNYKLLQAAFTKHEVQRHVDVNKLIRAKYQDNLEFCQWLKAFYDQSGVVRKDYDPFAVRARGKGGQQYNAQMGSKSSTRSHPIMASTKPAIARVSEAAGENMAINDELSLKTLELEQAVIDIEKERDFYFRKLRDVEIMFQVYQEKVDDGDQNNLVDDVFKILYATAEDNLTVNDQGDVVEAVENEPADEA